MHTKLCLKFGPGVIITGRNEVVAKVIFLHLSVIHFVHRVGSASVHAGIPPPTPQSRPPQSRHPPGADTPLEQTSPQEQTPRSRHPLEQTPPRSRHPPEQTPPEQTPPQEAESSIWSTSGVLLECILVSSQISFRFRVVVVYYLLCMPLLFLGVNVINCLGFDGKLR